MSLEFFMLHFDVARALIGACVSVWLPSPETIYLTNVGGWRLIIIMARVNAMLSPVREDAFHRHTVSGELRQCRARVCVPLDINFMPKTHIFYVIRRMYTISFHCSLHLWCGDRCHIVPECIRLETHIIMAQNGRMTMNNVVVESAPGVYTMRQTAYVCNAHVQTE